MPAVCVRFLVYQKPALKLNILKKIFVIEDDQDIAEIVEMALNHKYMVKTETDNREILNALGNFTPDLIMVDNYIGQKQAPEIMREIKNVTAYKNIPFVLFSGHQDIKRIAAEIDADAYLAKPFDLAELQKCIDGVLAKCA